MISFSTTVISIVTICFMVTLTVTLPLPGLNRDLKTEEVLVAQTEHDLPSDLVFAIIITIYHLFHEGLCTNTPVTDGNTNRATIVKIQRSKAKQIQLGYVGKKYTRILGKRASTFIPYDDNDKIHRLNLNNNNDHDDQHRRGLFRVLLTPFRRIRTFFQRFRNRTTTTSLTTTTTATAQQISPTNLRDTECQCTQSNRPIAQKSRVDLEDNLQEDNDATGNHGNWRQSQRPRLRTFQWLDEPTSSDDKERERSLRCKQRKKMKRSEFWNTITKPQLVIYSESTTELNTSSNKSIKGGMFDVNDSEENFEESCFDATSSLTSTSLTIEMFSNQPDTLPRKNIDGGKLDVTDTCHILESIANKDYSVVTSSHHDVKHRSQSSTSQTKEILSSNNDSENKHRKNAKFSGIPNASLPEPNDVTCCRPNQWGDDSGIHLKHKLPLLHSPHSAVATVRSLDFNQINCQLTKSNPQSSFIMSSPKGRRRERNSPLTQVPISLSAGKASTKLISDRPAQKLVAEGMESTYDCSRIQEDQVFDQDSRNASEPPKANDINDTNTHINTNHEQEALNLQQYQNQCSCCQDSGKQNGVRYRLRSLAYRPSCDNISMNEAIRSHKLILESITGTGKVHRVIDWVAYSDVTMDNVSPQCRQWPTSATSLLYEEVDELETVRDFNELKPGFVCDEKVSATAERLRKRAFRQSVCSTASYITRKPDAGLQIPINYRKYLIAHGQKKTTILGHRRDQNVSINPFSIDHRDRFFESKEYGDLLEKMLLENKLELNRSKVRITVANGPHPRQIVNKTFEDSIYCNRNKQLIGTTAS